MELAKVPFDGRWDGKGMALEADENHLGQIERVPNNSIIKAVDGKINCRFNDLI